LFATVTELAVPDDDIYREEKMALQTLRMGMVFTQCSVMNDFIDDVAETVDQRTLIY
jgi:hypothetical protein